MAQSGRQQRHLANREVRHGASPAAAEPAAAASPAAACPAADQPASGARSAGLAGGPAGRPVDNQAGEEVGHRQVFVAADQVAELGRQGVRLSSARLDLREVERREDEVLLARDVLDHQLVDTDGMKVIRAADLYLAHVGAAWRLVGVDVSMQTLARRLGPARWRWVPTPDQVIDWAAVQPFGIDPGQVRLRGSARRLRPGELADLLEDLG